MVAAALDAPGPLIATSTKPEVLDVIVETRTGKGRVWVFDPLNVANWPHRFGYAAVHGVDALLNVPLLAHQCDNPLCQNPRCWRESNHRANGQEYGRRRDIVRGALADTRGARGRARAVRDAARDGAPISEAVLAGHRPVHRNQLEIFPSASDPESEVRW